MEFGGEGNLGVFVDSVGVASGRHDASVLSARQIVVHLAKFPTSHIIVTNKLHAKCHHFFLRMMSEEHNTIYGISCHLRNSVTYPILERMLGYTDD
jgi:hypothetical protein